MRSRDLRKEAEDRLLKTRENLARVTRIVAMGELAAAIAHQVNQPLAAIVTNAGFCIRLLANAIPNSAALGADWRYIALRLIDRGRGRRDTHGRAVHG
jgi:C4-dicarboxylate-specific signal transduction histidine kinase